MRGSDERYVSRRYALSGDSELVPDDHLRAAKINSEYKGGAHRTISRDVEKVATGWSHRRQIEF